MSDAGERIDLGGTDDFLPRTKVLLIVSSFLGLMILYVLSSQAQVPRVHLDELGDHEGETVTVRARVTRVDHFESGSVRVYIREGNTTSVLFVENMDNELELKRGDELEATGTVQFYLGSCELIVEHGKNIRIVRRGKEDELFLSTLAHNSWNYRDVPVKASGYVKYDISYYCFERDGGEHEGREEEEGADESEYREFIHFSIMDGNGFFAIKVKLAREDVNETVWNIALSLQRGSGVVVEGTLRYNASDMRYFIELGGEDAVLEESGDTS